MPNVTLTRHVLAVNDLAASRGYFIDVLGFQIDPISAHGWAFLSLGSFNVMLGECPGERFASDTGNHSYFAFVLIDDIDRYYAEITARGAAMAVDIADRPWGLREFCVSTPEGHRIVFGQELQGLGIPEMRILRG